MVRVQILDDSFLFLLALASAVILGAAFIHAVSGLTGLEEAFPALCTGVLLPFVVGYLRIAFVKTNVHIERVRGWEIFVVGNAAIIATLVSDALRIEHVPIVIVGIAEVLIVLLGIGFARYITKKLVEGFEIHLTTEIRLAFVGSSAIGILFGAITTILTAFVQLFQLLSYTIIFIPLELLVLYTLLFYSYLTIGIERTCETLLAGSSTTNDENLNERQKRFRKYLEKGLLGNCILFVVKATHFMKHRRIAYNLAIISVALLVLAVLVLKIIGIDGVVTLFVAANITLGASLWQYLRIKKESLLV